MTLVGAAAAAEDAHARIRHFSGQGGKLRRRAVVHRLPVKDLGKSRVGLCNEGYSCIFPQPFELHQHLFGAGGAVQAEGVRPHALQNHQGGGHIRAAEGAPVLIAGEGDKNRLPADAFYRKQRRPGLRHGHHGLNDEQVHPGLFQGGGLLGVDVHQLLKAGLPQGIKEQSCGGNVSGHPGPPLRRLL